MRRRTLVLLAVASALASWLRAGEVEKDYGEAFAKLFDLGLPDTRGGMLVAPDSLRPLLDNALANEEKLPLAAPRPGVRFGCIQEDTRRDPGMPDTAWFLPAKDGQPARLVHGTAPVLPVGQARMAAPGEKSSVRSGVSAERQAKLGSVLGAQDMDEYVKHLLNPIITRQSETIPRLRLILARRLVFAAQLHRAGFVKEGNQIAAKVFEATNAPNLVVDDVVSLIADEAYEATCDRFLTDHDWEAYRTSLDRLLEKFPRGWRRAGAVKMVRDALIRRVKSLDDLPAPEGVVFDEKSLQAVKAILSSTEPPPGLRSFSDHDWLLEGAGAFYHSSNDNEPARRPWYELADRRFEAIPVLTACVHRSDVLLPVLTEPLRSHRHGPPAEEATDQDLLETLPHPLRLQDPALEFLRSVMRIDRETPGDLIADSALEWWKQHRNLDAVALARERLEGRASEAAFRGLVRIGSPEAIETVESYLLGERVFLGRAWLIEDYLVARGAAARPFYDTLRERILREFGDWKKPENAEGGRNSINGLLEENFGPREYVERLGLLVGATPPEHLIEEAGREGVNHELLVRRIETVVNPEGPAPGPVPDPEARHRLALRCAVAARSPDLRAQLTLWFGSRGFTMKAVPDSDASLWRALLDDQRIPRPDRFDCVMPTVAELAADEFSGIFDPKRMANQAILDRAFGKWSQGQVLLRAKARLDGKDVPTLGDDADVPEARASELVRHGLTAPADSLPAFVGSLSVPERLLWGEALSAADPFPPQWLERWNTLSEIRSWPADAAPPMLVGLRGQRLDAAKVYALIEEIGKQAATARTHTRIALEPDPAGLGLSAQWFASKRLHDQEHDIGCDPSEYPKDGQALIRILFIAQGVDEVIDDEFVMTPRGLVRVQLDFPGDDPGADPNERTDPALAKRRFLERCERVLKGRVDFFFIAGLPNHMVSGLQDEP